ncbi:MAG: hypothetical protein ACXAC7_02870 [Candidatus Hodarchaeales archaeon]
MTSNTAVIDYSSDLLEITHIEEKKLFSDQIRSSLTNRLRVLQLVGSFLVIFLFTYPTMAFIFELSKVVNVQETNFLITITLFVIFFTIILIYTSFRNRIAINQGLAFIFIWIAISPEPNQFFAVVKLILGLFLFELPKIQRFYSQYMNYYSSYPNTQFDELHRLSILFDQHLFFYIRIGIGITALSWMILAVYDQLNFDLGHEGSIVIPIIGICLVALYLFFSPKFLLTLKKRNNRKKIITQ